MQRFFAQYYNVDLVGGRYKLAVEIQSFSQGKTANDARPPFAEFKITKEDAANSLLRLFNSQKDLCGLINLAPNDFDINSNIEILNGVYVPVWLFDVLAESHWHGYNYHTESFPVTKIDSDGKRYTDHEERDVPDPVNSKHVHNYLLPIPASNEISQSEIEFLFKNGQIDLRDYNESLLNEMQLLTRDVDKTEARVLSEKRIKELEKDACKREVFELHGCSTNATYNAAYLAYLPAFILDYTHNGKSFRNIISGVTGEVQGKVPCKETTKFFIKVVKTISAIVVGVGGAILLFLILLGSR